MGYLRTFRANHQTTEDMRVMIDSIWNGIDNVVDKWTRGVADNNVVDIFNSYQLVQNAGGKQLFTKVHCFSIDFEDIQDELIIRQAINDLLDTISSEFQAIAVLYINCYGNYECVFLINAVSYTTYRNFHDNNATYINSQRYLNNYTGIDWFVDVSENTLFNNSGNGADRYQEFEC